MKFRSHICALRINTYKFFIIIASLCASYNVWALEHPAEGDTPGYGYVDSIAYDGKRISAQGWAATDRAAQQITSIILYLDNKPVYTGAFERLPRPDVASSLNRPNWLGSGWRVSFELPENISAGRFNVTASAISGAGDSINLPASKEAAQLEITVDSISPKHLARNIKLLIICSILILIFFFVNTSLLTRLTKQKFNISLSEPLMFSACLLVVSSVFVGVGITGSSLSLGQSNAPFLRMDTTPIMADDQPVRSDEWLVLTPLAIAQYNHQPRFPVVNTNLGEDGHNMLVIGMAGVPVAHLSAIAKPATWGFFLFDLRRALAWNWIFPIIACLLALAFTLNSISGTNWRHGFLFSALFCCAPYVVAWSNWPAYTVFFPCIIFLCALHILKVTAPYKLMLIGALLGVASAGFVFVLYPAWQVSVGYVFIAVTIGIFIRDKLYSAITPWRVAAYILGAAVAGTIIMAWWLDANSAINTMEQTVYPGRRFTVGGGMTTPMLLRGFTNIITLSHLPSPLSNQSEIASFYYLLLPLISLFIIRGLQSSLTAVEWSTLIATALILFYMYIGFAAPLAKYSLWSHVPPHRADLALGLCTLMLAHLLLSRSNVPKLAPTTTKLIGVVVTLVWIYVVYRSLGELDKSITAGFNSGIMIALLFVTAAMSYSLVTGQLKTFILVSLGLSLASTAGFNPINIAPKTLSIETRSPNQDFEGPIRTSRVLVLNNGITPMFLVAAGIPVANATFYYPQKKLWARLDPDAEYADVYNRYQHLRYSGVTSPAKDFALTTPQADVVNITVNLQTFDFRLSGAQMILAMEQQKSGLDENPSLTFVATDQGWCWFRTNPF